jgi:hypothetical protein
MPPPPLETQDRRPQNQRERQLCHLRKREQKKQWSAKSEQQGQKALPLTGFNRNCPRYQCAPDCHPNTAHPNPQASSQIRGYSVQASTQWSPPHIHPVQRIGEHIFGKKEMSTGISRDESGGENSANQRCDGE